MNFWEIPNLINIEGLQLRAKACHMWTLGAS